MLCPHYSSSVRVSPDNTPITLVHPSRVRRKNERISESIEIFTKIRTITAELLLDNILYRVDLVEQSQTVTVRNRTLVGLTFREDN
jgi:hypothetical protein